MDIDRLLALKEVRELFPADEKGNLPEGSCLLLSAMEELDFPPGRDIVTWGQQMPWESVSMPPEGVWI